LVHSFEGQSNNIPGDLDPWRWRHHDLSNTPLLVTLTIFQQPALISNLSLFNIQGVFLLDLYAPARRFSEFLLHFLKVIITAIVCLATVIDC